jgi:mRNA interferase MazF
MMSTPSPSRGEVWSVNFDPSVGQEQQKVRPAVVVSVSGVGRLPLRIVVPLTDWKPRYSSTYPWFVFVPVTPLNGLRKDSGADAFQVKSVAIQRFRIKLGTLLSVQMDDMAAAIALCVGYQ